MTSMQYLHDVLERVRNAGDDVKMSVVVVGTTGMFLMILFVWLTWFNTIGTLAETPGTELANVSASADGNGFSVWESIKAGKSALVGGIMNGVRGLGGVLNAPRKYIIEPER
ncbi:MAG: hypothetical protein RL681_786 [Candidatus Parcubacteria bacterium]|jgi:hypothetical protein